MKSSISALIVAVIAAMGALPAGTAAAAAPLPQLPHPNSHGITSSAMTDVEWLPDTTKPRLVNVKMRTDAVYRVGDRPEIQVRILLPANYNPANATPYEVLYLLHGGSGKFDDWSNNEVKSLVSGSPFQGLVVMPEGGSTGYYTNWFGHADNGFRPEWETFHIGQLVPWIDANFRTSGNRAGRFIAGLSMGAFGALKYAGQHPGLFSAVGSFSGGANIRPAAVRETISTHMYLSGAAIRTINFLDLGTRVNLYENGWPVQDDEVNHRQRDYRVTQLFGPEGGWAAFNPLDRAQQGVFGAYSGKLAIYSGGQTTGETDIYASSLEFHQALGQLPHRWCAGDGTHDWPFWKLDLIDFLEYLDGNEITCHYGS